MSVFKKAFMVAAICIAPTLGGANENLTNSVRNAPPELDTTRPYVDYYTIGHINDFIGQNGLERVYSGVGREGEEDTAFTYEIYAKEKLWIMMRKGHALPFPDRYNEYSPDTVYYTVIAFGNAYNANFDADLSTPKTGLFRHGICANIKNDINFLTNSVPVFWGLNDASYGHGQLIHVFQQAETTYTSPNNSYIAAEKPGKGCHLKTKAAKTKTHTPS